MSNERHQRISEKAHRQWELEGRPAGRDLDHWLQAERELEETSPTASAAAGEAAADAGASGQANEGEGNRTATRAYNRKARQFAEAGPVERQAERAVADLDGPAADELREAELVGRSHSHGEDPAVKRR